MRLEEVLGRLSDFGLQLKAKTCTFMQTEEAFLGHIVGRTGRACDPVKISAVWVWHAPGSVEQVCQFVGFVGILPSVHPKLSRTIGTSGGPNWERCYICMDSRKTGGFCKIEVLPAPGTDLGFSHRKRSL